MSMLSIKKPPFLPCDCPPYINLHASFKEIALNPFICYFPPAISILPVLRWVVTSKL